MDTFNCSKLTVKTFTLQKIPVSNKMILSKTFQIIIKPKLLNSSVLQNGIITEKSLSARFTIQRGT